MNGSDRLAELKTRGMKFGTAATRTLLDRLGSPDKFLKIIHIAGTNGKGSVAEFMTNILTAAGKRTGTFTSPEVYSYNGMYRINGKPLSDDSLSGYLNAAVNAAEGVEATSFEAETAAAIYAFYMEKCEYAVIECGMGGIDDATNAVAKKEIAIITSVSLEHTKYLGGTVREICEKKAGIVKGCKAVIHPLQCAEAMEYLSRVYGATVADKPVYGGGGDFIYKGKRFAASVSGYAQCCNAAVVIEAARLLKIDENAIYSGVNRTRPEGRTQIFKARGRTYILDGAHNPAAFAPLAELLNSVGGHRTVIYGCLSDKDADGCLSAIKDCCEEVYAVACGGSRARSLEETAHICRKYFKKTYTAESLSSALDEAKGDTVVVCGSFTLLKDALGWLGRSEG